MRVQHAAVTARDLEQTDSVRVAADGPSVGEALSADVLTAANITMDDLTVIEGIGPKIASLFHAAGITKYEQLADTPPAHLATVLRAGGPSFQMHDPSTWPEQAALAAAGRWEDLRLLAEKLDGGLV